MTAQSPVFALQNSAAHSAALFRQAVHSAWQTPGVLAPGELSVAAQSTPNMTVQVAAGRAWMKGTEVANVSGGSFSTQSAYFGLNDAPVTVTIAAANPTNPRIDVVYIATQDSFYSGSNNQPVIGVVTGTPAASPVAPAVPNNAVPLADVAVAANATSITNSNIASFTTASSGQAALRGTPLICTSTTHPTNVAIGQLGWESDTGNLIIATAGTGSSTTWKKYASSTPISWTQPTLAGFTNQSGYPVKYHKDALGYVHFTGRMTNISTYWMPSATVFTLPAGMRPGTAMAFQTASSLSGSDYSCTITVNATGEVYVSQFVGSAAAGQVFLFDGIAYLAEN